MIIAQAALAASPHRANKLFYSTPNSVEKKRLQLATKQGKRSITAESLSVAQPPATTGLLEPGLKCQARTMRCDKLLSSNSCTANFQLYTQMALRLEENGVHGENSSRFLCLFGSECGGGRVTSCNESLSEERCLNFGRQPAQILRRPVVPSLSFGLERHEIRIYCPPWVCLLACLFSPGTCFTLKVYY